MPYDTAGVPSRNARLRIQASAIALASESWRLVSFKAPAAKSSAALAPNGVHLPDRRFVLLLLGGPLLLQGLAYLLGAGFLRGFVGHGGCSSSSRATKRGLPRA